LGSAPPLLSLSLSPWLLPRLLLSRLPWLWLLPLRSVSLMELDLVLDLVFLHHHNCH
jgi:hypothetical protein